MTTPDLCVVVGATGAMGTEITLRLARRGLRVLAVARRGDELEKLAISDDLITPCVADIADDTAIDTISACIDSPVRMALFAAGLPVRGFRRHDSTRRPCRGDEHQGGRTRPPPARRPRPSRRRLPLRHHRRLPRSRTGSARRCSRHGERGGLQPHAPTQCPLRAEGCHHPHDRSRTGGHSEVRAFVETESAETGQDPEKIWNRYRAKTSLGRLPTLQEIGWIVETLLAPEAAVLHGSVINVDAGTRHGIH